MFVDSLDKKAGKGKDSKMGKKALADQPPDTPPLVSLGALDLWWVGRSYHNAALKWLQCTHPHECTYIHNGFIYSENSQVLRLRSRRIRDYESCLVWGVL